MTTVPWFDTIDDARSDDDGQNFSSTLQYMDIQAHNVGVARAIGLIFEINQGESESITNANLKLTWQSESNTETIAGWWKVVPDISSWSTGAGSPGQVYANSGASTLADTFPNTTDHTSVDLSSLFNTAVAGADFTGGTARIAFIFQSDTHTNQGGAIRWKRYDTLETVSGTPGQLQYDFAPSSIAVDGESFSSSEVRYRPNYQIARWYGADASGYLAPGLPTASDGVWPSITSGRWDLPFSNTSGQNILDSNYTTYINSRVKLAGQANVVRHPDRKAIGSFNELFNDFGTPYVIWNLWKFHPTKTSSDPYDVWSARFYHQAHLGNSNIWCDMFFAYIDGGADLIRFSYGGSPDNSRDIRLITDLGTTIGSGTFATGYNRFEIQASEYTDPKLTIRIYDDNSTTPLDTFTLNPTSVTIDSVKFGGRASPAVGGTDSYTADVEVWDDFNLGGQFPSEPGVITGGYPYVEPVVEWYEYDGVDVVPLDDEGTVRAVDGATPYYDSDVIPTSLLDWSSDLSGTNGNSFNPGVDDSFTSSFLDGDGAITYENATPDPPANVSQYLQHIISNDNAAAVTDLVTPVSRLYTSFLFRMEDFGGSNDNTTIFSAKDSVGTFVFSLRMSSSGQLAITEAQNTGATAVANLAVDTWYRIEMLYDADASDAKSMDNVTLRLFDESNPGDILATHEKDLADVSELDVRYLLFGPQTISGAAFSTFTCYTAYHAHDTDGWIGGPTSGLVVDEQLYPLRYGSYETSNSVYREAGMAYVPEADLPSPYLDIPYGLGTGNTTLRELDIHLPPGTPPATGWPAIIWVHGGSWARTDTDPASMRDEFQSFKDFCVTFGYAFITIGYQLSRGENIFGTGNPIEPYSLTDASAGRMPTFILDVKQALHWIKNNAGDSPYNININKMVGTGYSAGTYNIAAAAYTRGLTSDGSGWNWTLAGNTGSPYYYDDEGEGDPDVLQGIYLFAPPVSPYLLYLWENDLGPGAQWNIPGRSGGIGYTTVRNMYANDASWISYAGTHEMYDFIVGNPTAVVATGANFGSADWFVTNDWLHQTGGYGQMPRLQEAFDDAVGIPAGSELDIYVNSINHDYVMADRNVEHFLNFLRKHL